MKSTPKKPRRHFWTEEQRLNLNDYADYLNEQELPVIVPDETTARRRDKRGSKRVEWDDIEAQGRQFFLGEPVTLFATPPRKTSHQPTFCHPNPLKGEPNNYPCFAKDSFNTNEHVLIENPRSYRNHFTDHFPSCDVTPEGRPRHYPCKSRTAIFYSDEDFETLRDSMVSRYNLSETIRERRRVGLDPAEPLYEPRGGSRRKKRSSNKTIRRRRRKC